MKIADISPHFLQSHFYSPLESSPSDLVLVVVVVCVVVLVVLGVMIVLVGVSIYCLRVSRMKRDFRLTHKAEVGVYMLPWRQNSL